MDVLSLKEMAAREEAAFASGVSAAALMEAAGAAMAGKIMANYPRATGFLVLVGKGNNGGDGLVVARHLTARGQVIRVVLAAQEDALGELPVANLKRLRADFPTIEIIAWKAGLDIFPGSEGVVIDALLGVQARGPLRGTIAEIVAALNHARTARFFRTVALDLPTGLAALGATGDAPAAPRDHDCAVIADLTIAVGFAKEILCREELSPWVGRLEIVAWSNDAQNSTPRQVLVGAELTGLLPRRNALTYKGDFGKLVIIGGSPGFTGAPLLGAHGAQGIGTGLLSLVTKPGAASIVASQAPPEAMVSAWPEDGSVPDVVRHATAIAIGPGLGTDEATARILHAVLKLALPVVLDADALTVLARDLDLLRSARGPIVLTPHTGEMARLLGRKFAPHERESVARAFADQHGVTLVLKGTRTLVTAPGQPIFINTTGNAGLATGGSGDTLTGIIGALLAQKMAPLDAARLGVWLHGHAADLVLAGRGCEEGMTPTMLSGHLGAALVSLRAQAAAPPGLLERAQA